MSEVMDGLPSIKPLTRTQLLIRAALKSVPPLNITKPLIAKEFVVFGDQSSEQFKCKTKSNSLYDRFLSHKKSNSNTDESPTKKSVSSVHKWSQLKDSLTQELETKRLQTQKEREINDKLENEDIDEDVDEVIDEDVDEVIDEDVDQVIDDLDDNKVSNNGSVCDEESEVDDDCNDDEEEGEECGVEEEEEECDEEEDENEMNYFIDDEADVDEEEEDNYDEEDDNNGPNEDQNKDICDNSKKDFKRDSVSVKNVIKDNKREQMMESMASEESEEVLNTSIISTDESSDRKFATQKIALSPFVSQKLKPRFPVSGSQELSDLVLKLDTNGNDFDSQTLVDLCSGGFTQNNEQNNTYSEKMSQSVVAEEEDEDKDVLIGSKKVGKVFNIESDCESDVEESKDVLKSSIKTELSIKSVNESDGEDLIASEAEESDADDEEVADEEVNEEEIQTIGKGFFDNEAELSGSDDVSSDEEDNEDNYEEVGDGEEEDLPSDSEIRDQIGRYHNKTLLDEDKRQLLVLKEMMFDDGDLHDGTVRQKKFNWNFETNDEFVNDYINEDSDDNYFESDDENESKTPALKMFDQKSDKSSTNDKHLEKLKTKFKLNSNLKVFNQINSGFESKKRVDLSSFVVRDERLKTIMSTKRTVTTSAHKFKSNKRHKNCKTVIKPSVFDLIHN